jgi:DNA/RNA-binding domain of Phe-tRNA-synthetase-like protein/ubiquinone/menaquinone biosynthesis C-methylase UbiE
LAASRQAIEDSQADGPVIDAVDRAFLTPCQIEARGAAAASRDSIASRRELRNRCRRSFAPSDRFVGLTDLSLSGTALIAALASVAVVTQQLWSVYDEMALAYQRHAENSPYNAHYDRPAVFATLGPVAGMHVLDAACGPGLYAKELLARGASVTAFDASPAMLELAKANTAKSSTAGVAVQIDRAVLGEPLPYEDGAFDAIVCALAIHYADDRAAAFAELFRVLRLGGALVVSSQHPFTDWLRKGGSYFDVTLETDVWELADWSQEVRFWREPLSSLCAAATSAGFLIETLVEPLPADSMRDRWPADYEKLVTTPGFLILRLLKPGDRNRSARSEAEAGARHLLGTRSKGEHVYFEHDAAIWRDFPALVPGVLFVDGINSGAEVGSHVAAFNRRVAARLAGRTESELPEIQAWRRTFAAMGLKPTQYRCASESLLRRFRKEGELPRLHPLVDLCNAVSIACATPIAVFDAAKIDSYVQVRYASGDEKYLTFSGETEHPAAGEVIFADEAGQAHARRWTNRQSALSAVRDTTSAALIVAEALHASAAADVADLIETLMRELEDVWTVRPHVAVLTPDSPRFSFGTELVRHGS